MVKATIKGLMLAVLVADCPGLAADDAMNPERARYHYQMFCQGCHTPDGAGANAIPPLKDFMGYFLRSQRGREFMVRVPGSALSCSHVISFTQSYQQSSSAILNDMKIWSVVYAIQDTVVV